MKKYYFFILFLSAFFLGSCIDKEERLKKIHAIRERRERSEKAEQAKLDSIVGINSRKVWTDLLFGMSKNKVLGMKSFANAIDLSNGYYRVDAEDLDLYGFHELSHVELYFNEKGRFQGITFYSNKHVSANHIDDMEKECKEIISKIESLMEISLRWKKLDISVLDFNEGESFTPLEEYYGNTAIKVEMGESYEGAEYYYTVGIREYLGF